LREAHCAAYIAQSKAKNGTKRVMGSERTCDAASGTPAAPLPAGCDFMAMIGLMWAGNALKSKNIYEFVLNMFADELCRPKRGELCRHRRPNAPGVLRSFVQATDG
jgi:hypothetical protein